jgi:beta-N-acetylglucosaminidase
VGNIFDTVKNLLFFTDRETYSLWSGVEIPIMPPVHTEFSIESDLKTRVSPLTADKIDTFFRSQPPEHRGLEGIGKAVIEASRNFLINATYIVAHAILETYWGTSSIYKKTNNLFGWNAYDARPDSATRFTSPEQSIDFVMRKVDKLYLTPGAKFFRTAPCVGNKSFGMNVCYARESDWGSTIAEIARQIEKTA